MSLRVAELCAGYGGLGLGLSLAGVDHGLVWWSEIDPSASTVMAAHTAAPNLGDLVALSNPPQVDLVCAGFPCQPVSQPGLRRGIDDERWLVQAVCRTARASGAQWLLLENVVGIFTANNGRALSEVCAALAEAGFSRWEWTTVRASDVGAPHRRERWFCLASNPDSEGLEGWGVHPECGDERAAGAGGVGVDGRFGPFGRAVDRWAGSMGRRAPEPTVDGRLNPELVEWMMGLPEGWVTGCGLSRAQAIHCLGNGVVPQAAAHAVRLLTSDLSAPALVG